MLKKIQGLGIRSEHAYLAGFASIGLSFVSWVISRINPKDPKAQSDRWGLFVGEWAPTLLALGVALKLEENNDAAGLPNS